MFSSKIVGTLKLCLGLTLLVASVGPSMARKAHEAIYYRLKVDLRYKDADIGIDIVVGCGVTLTSYSFGGSSQDVMAMSAARYVRAIPDGHAIGIITVPHQNGSHPCSGATTANGRIPKNWLPVVVWFEDVNELGTGIGYATQDAYASPKARIAFRSAVVEKATREEFEEFQRTGPANLLPPHLADWMYRGQHAEYPSAAAVPRLFVERPQRAWITLSNGSCQGVIRIPLTEAQRERVRAFWPSDRPRFWTLPDTTE